MRLFVVTGILGGYTTLSTFSLETVVLLERSEPALAIFYALASVALGLGGSLLACTLFVPPAVS